MTSNIFERTTTISMSDDCLLGTVGVLANIVGTACEQEPDLSVIELVNLVDLYRTYLSATIPALTDTDASTGQSSRQSVFLSEPKQRIAHHASFEQFIGDQRLLQLAANAASRETGVAVPMPPARKPDSDASPTPRAFKRRPAHGDTATCADSYS